MPCDNDCNNNSVTYSCVEELRSLHREYLNAVKGFTRKRVESSDGSRGAVVEYAKADPASIANAYNQLWLICGRLAPELPSVIKHTPVSTTQRGRPVYGRWF